jgi:hypothetical protein
MHVPLSPHLRSLGALQAQISAQNEISCLLREHLHDLRASRDAWRSQAEAARHVLVDGRPRRTLSGWSSTIAGVGALFERCLLVIFLAALLVIPAKLISVSQESVEAVFRCLLPAFDKVALPAEKTRISKLPFVSSNYAAEERDYLIRTIAFEASGESEEGQAAVAHVILTRKRSGKWGDTIKEVVTHPWQFEAWMRKRAEMESLDAGDYRYRNAARIADAVLAGQTPDPTSGATHFLNPTVVQRRGGSLPAWATGAGLSIGRHTFYAPDEVAWTASVTRPSIISCW